MSQLQSNSFTEPPDDDIRSGLKITWVGIAANVLLIVMKLWIGSISKSQALVADAIHSASDLFSDFVVMLGLRWGRKSEDDDHPYGHARIETISSMIVGLILGAVGVGIGLSAISAIFTGQGMHPSLPAIVVAVLSVGIKEGLYWMTVSVGRRLQSPVLIANAWHHRSDALSSVAVLIGVTTTYSYPNLYLADSIAALVVTGFIVKVGAQLIWSALKELSDTAPDREVIERLTQAALEVSGVREVHDVKARFSGAKILVELDVVVDPSLTVREGHDIGATVKKSLLTRFPSVTRVKTHIDPEPKIAR